MTSKLKALGGVGGGERNTSLATEAQGKLCLENEVRVFSTVTVSIFNRYVLYSAAILVMLGLGECVGLTVLNRTRSHFVLHHCYIIGK